MIPYRFNPFEMDLLQRLTFKVYLNNQNFIMNRWPIIFWGDFDKSNKKKKVNDDYDDFENRDYNIYDIDLLGRYIYPKNQEGYIEIYGDRIHECALRISVNLNLDFQLTRSLLQSIVLLHEIGHWFSHYCFRDNLKHRMHIFPHQTKEIKETIAQLSVLWSVLRLKNQRVNTLRLIMDFLAPRQSWEYNQFLLLGKKYSKTSTILNRYVQLLDSENCDLNYLLLINKKMDPFRAF